MHDNEVIPMVWVMLFGASERGSNIQILQVSEVQIG